CGNSIKKKNCTLLTLMHTMTIINYINIVIGCDEKSKSDNSLKRENTPAESVFRESRLKTTSELNR
ncbi:MAG: hypothetical protein N2484_13760, partial [Clostridia bacterium]|nr:hypothetical protein [Clostridia bacterium]